MKVILTSAKDPDEYIACLGGWQRRYAEALRLAVSSAAPELGERLKWGHLVYFLNGPVLLIRAEPTRVLFGFWRGQRLRHIEPRLRPGGKYEMATLELRQDTPLPRATVTRLAAEAAALNRAIGDPTDIAKPAAAICKTRRQVLPPRRGAHRIRLVTSWTWRTIGTRRRR